MRASCALWPPRSTRRPWRAGGEPRRVCLSWHAGSSRFSEAAAAAAGGVSVAGTAPDSCRHQPDGWWRNARLLDGACLLPPSILLELGRRRARVLTRARAPAPPSCLAAQAPRRRTRWRAWARRCPGRRSCRRRAPAPLQTPHPRALTCWTGARWLARGAMTWLRLCGAPWLRPRRRNAHPGSPCCW